MLSSDLKTVIAPLARTMTIIWGAMMAATMIYLFVGWIMFGQGAASVSDAGAAPTMMRPIFGVVAFLLVIASIFMERWWFSGKAIMGKLSGSAVFAKISPQGGAGGPSREVFESLAESEKKLACLMPYFQTGMIVIWSMREAVAVLGLVLAVIEKDYLVMIPFALGAAVLVAIKAPRPVAFLERVRSLPGAPI